MRRDRAISRWAAMVVLAGLGFAGTGCVHHKQMTHQAAAIVVPPPGAVPRELDKVTLPEYVIEPPDVLRIEAVIRVVNDKNKVTDEIQSMPIQPVYGEYQVRPDGSVFLGVYGSVSVAGYTLRQAAAAIRETLAKQAFTETDGIRPETLLVILDVAQYNSKRYFVIQDGGGYGETVTAFPITGSETVLDAISNVGGLNSVASKRNIWVARRCPTPGIPDQILPVDWIGLTQHGVTATNYQIMPGDRVYVKAERLVTIDTALARILSPVERIFGVTLLGANTVNQIRGQGFGFRGN